MSNEPTDPKMVRFYFLDGDDYIEIPEDALAAMDEASDEYERRREEARKREREEFYFLSTLDD